MIKNFIEILSRFGRGFKKSKYEELCINYRQMNAEQKDITLKHRDAVDSLVSEYSALASDSELKSEIAAKQVKAVMKENEVRSFMM